MSRLRLAVFGLLALLGQHSTAQTTVTQWGVSASAAYADCSLLVFANFESCNRSNGGLSLFGGWLPTPSAQSGGLNATSADTLDVPQLHDTAFAGDNLDMGTTRAFVQLDNNNLSVPILKAKALSNDDNGWVSALAFGIQGYQYTGLAPTSIALNVALTGTIANPLNGTVEPLGAPSDVTGFSIGVWLLSPDPAFVFPAPAATLGELAGNALAASTDIGSWTLDITDHGAVNQPNTVNSTRLVQPNEAFYLMAGLVAAAAGAGRSADAFGTLTMSFVNPDGLVAAGVAPVPEPQSYAMMLVGLGLIAGATARARKGKQALR